jgi:hypothetical protein
MNTTRKHFSPVAIPIIRLAFILAVVAVCLGTGFAGPSLGQDNIGIFWDAAYTQDSTTTNTYPSILTGYLVLKDVSTPFGLLGWECCADVDGPAQFISWLIEGQAINVATVPCFMVGISPDPIPSDGDALLATFQILVTEPLPVSLSVRPLYIPSVPDQMSFIPADDPGALLPMTTASGQPEVAWINGHIPNLQVDPTSLHFDNTIIGTQVVKTVTVSNVGSTPGFLDVALTGDCGTFSLPGLSGPVTVPAGESRTIEVAFTPVNTDLVLCDLALGAGLDDVQMVGSGRELVIAWQAPTEVDFGSVSFGQTQTRSLVIRNIGEAEFLIDPFIPLSCPEFVITGGGFPTTILPGYQHLIFVTFQPANPDTFSCYLDLGSVVPAVLLMGVGEEPTLMWEISPAALEFGPVGIGYGSELTVTIFNTGDLPFLVAPTLPQPCPEFTITGGAAPIQVDPGGMHDVTVWFVPSAPDDYVCSLNLGEGLPDVPMTGSGRDPILDWDAPTSHDFGLVGVGESTRFTFNVTNTGDISFQVDPSLPDSSQSFRLILGAPTFLGPGQSVAVVVDFQPVVPGLHSCLLDLGSTVPAIQLQGEGDPRPETWVVTPTFLDFGWIYVGDYQQETVIIDNVGGTFLELDISLEDADMGYSIPRGAGAYQLAPGYSHEVDVLFQPETPDIFETTLNLGPLFPYFPITGGAEPTDDICIIQPDTLVFGPIEIGYTQTRTYSVTNNGNQPLQITPSSNSPVFVTVGLDRTLESGQTAYFSVVFQPQVAGSYTATIDLGSPVCTGVSLIGTATMQGGVGQNLVGIFFDPDYSYIEAQTFSSNEIVEGYLVLIEPSETSGVGAWELAADIDGDAQWLSWDLEGQHINVGQGNEFIVGIGGSPLPYSPAVLLATFQILVAEPFPNVVNLELGPIQTPSLPGQMVWAPWDDASMLMPMLPHTGDSIVAVINWSAVGIGHPAPQATLAGGAVELQWPVPEQADDGCHVYRRDEASVEIRLTDQPLSGYGSILTYTDRPEGYAAGSVLYYSYTVVADGAESARSLETEIRLTDIPALTTHLLPNVPNPFNPMTEIRFELASQQRARVAVYDVTGHLVKVLADGQLEAGTHIRIWQGRDSGDRQVPSGAYHVRLETDSKVDHHKIMLLK